ncbi:MAG: magnesium transporter [Candidatus Pacebacteria bacterium]|nr:magnesium transporter [Candidatus Paceibacterota bacterium]
MSQQSHPLQQRGPSASTSPPVQLLSTASSEFNDDYDYEASCLSGGGAGETTLSSAEASFDRLLQSVAHRDRAHFAAYVRAEVDRDTSTATTSASLPKSRSSNGLHHADHPASLLHTVASAYSQLSPWWRSVLDRFYLLAGLLFLQSCSSLILSHFADFIQKHVIVTVGRRPEERGRKFVLPSSNIPIDADIFLSGVVLFCPQLYLTMLVGAGGNAGNQASVLVIRLLATSSRRIQPLQIMRQELQVAGVIGLLMVVVGFSRVYLFEGGNWRYAVAITASLYVIVTVSIIVGAALPLLLQRMKLDPAHAGPIIQVLMDVSGVLCTCAICSVFLGDASEPSDVALTSAL